MIHVQIRKNRDCRKTTKCWATDIAKIAENFENGKVKDCEMEASNQRNIMIGFKSEIETLKQQFEKASEYKEKVVEAKATI